MRLIATVPSGDSPALLAPAEPLSSHGRRVCRPLPPDLGVLRLCGCTGAPPRRQPTLSFLTPVDPSPSSTPFLGGAGHGDERRLLTARCGRDLSAALPLSAPQFPVCTASARDSGTLLLSGVRPPGVAKGALGGRGQKGQSCNLANVATWWWLPGEHVRLDGARWEGNLEMQQAQGNLGGDLRQVPDFGAPCRGRGGPRRGGLLPGLGRVGERPAGTS